VHAAHDDLDAAPAEVVGDFVAALTVVVIAVMPTRSTAWFRSSGSIFSSTILTCQSGGRERGDFQQGEARHAEPSAAAHQAFAGERGDEEKPFHAGGWAGFCGASRCHGGKAPQRTDGAAFAQPLDETPDSRAGVAGIQLGRKPGELLELREDHFVGGQVGRHIVGRGQQVGVAGDPAFAMARSQSGVPG
jgi:hypothetical protein